MKKNILLFITFLFVLPILAACASATPQVPTVTPAPPTETAAPPTDTAMPLPTDTPTLTSPPPTDTPTPEPTLTSTPAFTDTPAATVTFTPPPKPTYPYIPLPAASSDTVNIYFVQNIAGSGECNIRIFAVSSGIKLSGDVEDDVKAGLTKLFSYKDIYYGELYNPLYKSRIRVQKVDFNNKNGLIEVWMTGSYRPSGDPCDNTGVKGQVWSTIKQFRGIETTNIFLNDLPFGDRVSNDK